MSSTARLHRFTPVYGEWPQCDLCGEREDAPIHKQPEEPSAARIQRGHFQLGRLYVAWSHRDGLHLIGPRRHLHAFIWTRGHRRNPVYVRLSRV